MRFLVCYNTYGEGHDRYYEAAWDALRQAGHDVRGFCLSIRPGTPAPRFGELDRAWRRGDARLLRHLERLSAALEDRDVLVNWHGMGLPPEFVHGLNVHTVYMCSDDPESSHDLSRPMAWAYDQCLVQNVAAVDLYRDWGCRDVAFLPMGLMPCNFLASHSKERLGLDRRDIDVMFAGERLSAWRRVRLDRLSIALPDGVFFGPGWPGGYLSRERKQQIYARTKIGLNLHNSTGPINWRLYELPAHGIMQLCDNRSHLPAVFENGVEIVGYDTIAECVERVRYYLEHDSERQSIALAGYERVCRDYTLPAVWRRLEAEVSRAKAAATSRSAASRPATIVTRQGRETRFRRLADRLLMAHGRTIRKLAGKMLAGIRSRAVSSSAVGMPSLPPGNPRSVRIGVLAIGPAAYGHCRAACDELDVPCRPIDILADNWLKEAERSGCDGFILDVDEPRNPAYALMLNRVRILAERLHKPVRPSIPEIAMSSDSRLAIESLLASDAAPRGGHFFLCPAEALDYLAHAEYPVWIQIPDGALGSGGKVYAAFHEVRRALRARRLLKRSARSGVLAIPRVLSDSAVTTVWQAGAAWYTQSAAPPVSDAVLRICAKAAQALDLHQAIFTVAIDRGGAPAILACRAGVARNVRDASDREMTGTVCRAWRDGRWVDASGWLDRNHWQNGCIVEFCDEIEAKLRPHDIEAQTHRG